MIKLATSFYPFLALMVLSCVSDPTSDSGSSASGGSAAGGTSSGGTSSGGTSSGGQDGSGASAVGGSSSGGQDGGGGSTVGGTSSGGRGGMVSACTSDDDISSACHAEQDLACAQHAPTDCDSHPHCQSLRARRIDPVADCAEAKDEMVGCGAMGCGAASTRGSDLSGATWLFPSTCIPPGWTWIGLRGAPTCSGS